MSEAGEFKRRAGDNSRWNGFHIDPTISLGHIITTLTIAVSVIWWASTVETRLGNHDVKIEHVENTAKAYATTAAEQRKEIREDLREIKAELRELTNYTAKNARPR